MWSSGPAGAASAKFRRGPAAGTVGDERGSVLGLLGFDLGARLWARGCRGAGTPVAGGWPPRLPVLGEGRLGGKGSEPASCSRGKGRRSAR
jgi:hypothetical protein